MAHTTEIKVKVTPKSTKYLHMVDGKVVRTSTRRYAYSTADGSYFSSRLDLLERNAEYQRAKQNAEHCANLTEAQHREEQEAEKTRRENAYGKYRNERLRDEWVEEMVGILSHYGRNPTEDEIKKCREENLAHWAEWLARAKDSLEKIVAFLNDPNAMAKDLEEKRVYGRERLNSLEIVEY